MAPTRVDTSRLVRAQVRGFAELAVTQHIMSNFRIFFDENTTGRVVAVMPAEHWIRVEPESEEMKRYTMFD